MEIQIRPREGDTFQYRIIEDGNVFVLSDTFPTREAALADGRKMVKDIEEFKAAFDDDEGWEAVE